MSEKRDIRSVTLAQWEELLTTSGFQKYRAKQVYQWIHEHGIGDVAEMTNIPKDIKEFLGERYAIALPEIAEEQISREDGTRKYLLRLADGAFVECVLMQYHYGNSLCISTQVGCRMGCKFCASTLRGLERNLESGEMLGEVYAIAKSSGKRISHIVLMGMGEPLDNYDNVVDFLRRISDPNGQNISMRNLTLSTCGIVPNMRKLADEGLAVTLALSLHASSQEERMRLLPVARKYAIEEVLDACSEYFKKTGRRVSFEYALVAGENDAVEDAEVLARLLKDQHGHVNLIPVNPVTETGMAQPDQGRVRAFAAVLEKRNIPVTVRREMGRDIDGACGQLRGKRID